MQRIATAYPGASGRRFSFKNYDISNVLSNFAIKYVIYHIMARQETVFDIIVELGRRFKEYRKALGFSQQDIHRKTGVALSTISLFENGKGHGLSLTHFYLLLDALDLEMEPDTIIPDAFRSDLAGQWEKQNKRSRK